VLALPAVSRLMDTTLTQKFEELQRNSQSFCWLTGGAARRRWEDGQRFEYEKSTPRQKETIEKRAKYSRAGPDPALTLWNGVLFKQGGGWLVATCSASCAKAV
jgi:hypothetical protein